MLQGFSAQPTRRPKTISHASINHFCILLSYEINLVWLLLLLNQDNLLHIVSKERAYVWVVPEPEN